MKCWPCYLTGSLIVVAGCSSESFKDVAPLTPTGSDAAAGSSGADASVDGDAAGSDAASCPTGKADCDGNPANGCETDSTSNASHCSGCGKACKSADNAVAKCQASVCTSTCNSGWGDCDKSATNGCELDLKSNVTNCGGCAKVCGTDHGTASCASGQCSLQCSGSWQDCDGLNDNGCESDGQVDGMNCGSCGHSCQGSPCAAGLCAPVQVATYNSLITALAAYGDSLYMTADTPSQSLVLKVAKSGGTPAVIVTTGNAAALVVEASGIYWVGTNGWVRGAPLTGGVAKDLSWAGPSGRLLVLDSSAMYWVAGAQSDIFKASKNGETAIAVATPAEAALGALAVDDTKLFMTLMTMNSLQSVEKSGGTPTVLVGGQETPKALVLDGADLYWTNFTGDTVVSMPSAGGAVRVLSNSPAHPTSLTTDAANVYWETSAGSLHRVAKTGGDSTVVATGQNVANYLVVDDTHLYWVNNVAITDVTVWKVAK